MKRGLISNTGPLIALAVVEQLDLLRSLFDTVSIPVAVHEEILQGGSTGVGVQAYQEASWIEVEPLQGPIDPLLAAALDRGESTVIQLALEKGASTVLIDEQKARKIARRIYNLNVIGTVGILLEAKKRNILPSVRDILGAMRQSGYWIHSQIVEAALKQAGEL